MFEKQENCVLKVKSGFLVKIGVQITFQLEGIISAKIRLKV